MCYLGKALMLKTRNIFDLLLEGKKARDVSVLSSEIMYKSIDLVLKHSKEAGVPSENPYLFEILGKLLSFKHLDVWVLMRRFAVELNTVNPERLRESQGSILQLSLRCII